MPAQQPLYIVVTDFDGWAQTRICLEHLRRSTYQDFTVLLIDHGTTPETAAGVAEFEFCEHVAASSELWWTGATNVGIRAALEAGAIEIMLLNNDCYVAPDTLAALRRAMALPEVSIVAPLQCDATSGAIEVGRTSTCLTLGFPSLHWPGSTGIADSNADAEKTRMIVGGRGVLIGVDVFSKVGLFAEADLPHYGADHDFYLRCRRSGLQLWLAPAARVAIDSTHTSIARSLGSMSWQDFRTSLASPRSHRNFDMLVALFRRNYPVRSLYGIGVALNLLRYFGSWLLARGWYRLSAAL